jgi:O-antigen/teichoic acid export membrane protein
MILQNELFSRIRETYAWYIVGYLSFFVFSFIKIPLLSYFYEPGEVGIYALSVSILSYLHIFVFSWIAGTFWRFIYDENFTGSKQKFLNAIIPIIIVSAVLGTVIISAIAFFYRNADLNTLLIYGFLSVILQELASIYILFLQSSKKIKLWGIVLLLQNIAAIILLFVLIYFVEMDIYSVFLSTIFFNSLLLLVLLFRHTKFFWAALRPDIRLFEKTFIMYALVLILINFSWMLLNNADRFVIQHHKGEYDLGLYSQSYSLGYLSLYAVIQLFTTIFLPVYNRNIVRIENPEINNQIIMMYLLLMTPIFLVLFVSGTELTTLILSEKFEGYGSVMSIVLAGIYLFGIANFLEIRLKLSGKAMMVASVIFFVAVFNILANVILLKYYSFQVSAVISFISYGLALVLFLIFNYNIISFANQRSLLIALLLSSLVYILICYFINTYLPDFSASIIYSLVLKCIAAAIIFPLFLWKDFIRLKPVFKEVAI